MEAAEQALKRNSVLEDELAAAKEQAAAVQAEAEAERLAAELAALHKGKWWQAPPAPPSPTPRAASWRARSKDGRQWVFE